MVQKRCKEFLKVSTGFKVVSTYRFTPTSLQLLQDAASAEVSCVSSQEELLEQLPETEVLCSFSVPDRWQELAPELRWLQYPGAGVDGTPHYTRLCAMCYVLCVYFHTIYMTKSSLLNY